MAIKTADKRGGIGSSMRGLFYTYKQGDKYIASKWPEKRGKPKTEAQAQSQALFKEACQGLKSMDAHFIEYARKDCVGKPMLPRDALMAMGYGRGPTIELLDGRKMRAMATRVDLSELLDNIAWEPGTVLYRNADDMWVGLSPGLEGEILTVDENRMPKWSLVEVEPGGGGSWEVRNPRGYTAPVQPTVGVRVQKPIWLTITQVSFVHSFTPGNQYRLRIYGLTGDRTISSIMTDVEMGVFADSTERRHTHKLADPLVLMPNTPIMICVSRVGGTGNALCQIHQQNSATAYMPGSPDSRYFETTQINPAVGLTFTQFTGGAYAISFQG